MDVNTDELQPSGVQRLNVGIFTFLIVVAEVLVVASLALVGVWTGYYRDGFAWREEPKKEFNYHPLFMIIGLVFLFGNGILSYRILRYVRKPYLKLVHALMLGGTAILWAFGLVAAFDSHNLARPPIPNLYSLHSWLGLATVSLFAIQWLFGLVSFLLPVIPLGWRKVVKPMHVSFGTAIFMLGAATALTGLTEKLLWTLGGSYAQFVPEGILANCLGIAVALAVAVITYIVNNTTFQRRPLAND